MNKWSVCRNNISRIKLDHFETSIRILVTKLPNAIQDMCIISTSFMKDLHNYT